MKNLRPRNRYSILWFAAAAFGFAGAFVDRRAYAGAVVCIAIIALVSWLGRHRNAPKEWLARASDRPIVLRPPFSGRWRVVEGGPDRAHNRYQQTKDGYFAYDFAFVDGSSDGRAILAPCDGLIAHVDAQYVSIETDGGYVVLSHLEADSIVPHAGATVTTGAELARCGDHLHIYAQDRALADLDIAQAVPIAFVIHDDDEPLLLEFGDVLGVDG